MEYLEGQPLHRIVQRSGEALRLTLAMRLTILVRTLAALHYAHELTDYDGTPLHIVHRDVGFGINRTDMPKTGSLARCFRVRAVC